MQDIIEYTNTIEENLSGYRDMLNANYDASEIERELELIDAVESSFNQFTKNERDTGCLLSTEEMVITW